MVNLAVATVLHLCLASVSAQAGPWAAPFCVVWPLMDDEDSHCEAALGVGLGTCDAGYEATWMGTCEVEHDDSHDHWSWDLWDQWHWTDFGHDDHPPPPSPSPPPV